MCHLGVGLCSGLSLGLFLAPQLIFEMLGIEGHPSTEFIARRASMIVAGLGVSLQLEQSGTPKALGYGMATSMSGLAILGTCEWLRGAAKGNLILGIIVTEALMAIGFANALVQDKKQT